jgi:hypothetical protein
LNLEKIVQDFKSPFSEFAGIEIPIHPILMKCIQNISVKELDHFLLIEADAKR